MNDQSTSSTTNLAHTVLWGLFCACSWTWCIGMYLPKILIERYGVVGFVAFAVPNVLGCAAFGYVLATRQRSERLIAQHRDAMVLFSIVTCAFHVFFLMLLTPVVLGPDNISMWPGIAVALAAFGVAFGSSFFSNRTWLVVTAVVYAVSITAFVVIGLGAWDRLQAPGNWDAAHLAWLTPVICIGFLLCPYLDLTFHRALQHAPSRHAFGVFGGTFLIMIIFTCFLWFSQLRTWAIVHLLTQSVFTMGVHLREIREHAPAPQRAGKFTLMMLPLLALPVYPIASRLATGEFANATYLRFLVFYGLVFPAYVLVFIGPLRGVAPTVKRVLGLVLVIGLLAPLYELGFLRERFVMPDWLGGAVIDPTSMLLAIPVGLAGVWMIVRATAARRKTPRG